MGCFRDYWVPDGFQLTTKIWQVNMGAVVEWRLTLVNGPPVVLWGVLALSGLLASGWV